MKKNTLFLLMFCLSTIGFSQIAISPLWEVSAQAGNLGTSVNDVKSGFDVSADGTKLYLATNTADANQVAIYDASNGNRSGYLPGLVGFAATYGGDVAVDDNGAIYMSNVTLGATGTTNVAKWDNETATPTLFIFTVVGAVGRLGYGMDVKVDTSGNGFVIMHENGTANFYIWTVVANTVPNQTPVQVVATGAVITDSYARISIVDDTHFWIDGNTALPTYCTLTILPDEAPVIVAERIVTRLDMNVGVAGATEFTYDGKRYAVFAGNNHAGTSNYAPKHHAKIQEMDAAGVGVVGNVLAVIPEKGMGGSADYKHFVKPVVHSSAAGTYIYLMGGYNGVSAFKVLPAKVFTVIVPEGTENVYIAGSFTDKNWDITTPHQLTATGNANEFSGTFACENSVEYKYLCHSGDWDYQEASAVDPLTEGTNRTYADNDVVSYWKAMPKVILKVTFATTSDEPTDLYVKSDIDNWATGIKLTAGTPPATNTFRNTQATAFTVTIGNGTTDKIFANTQYKYYTTSPTEPNWEANADRTARGNRWSIYPTMNDKIQNFEQDLGVGINSNKMHISITTTSLGVRTTFNGEAAIELYNLNGILIDKTNATNIYEHNLANGAYIICINGKAIKFVK